MPMVRLSTTKNEDDISMVSTNDEDDLIYLLIVGWLVHKKDEDDYILIASVMVGSIRYRRQWVVD